MGREWGKGVREGREKERDREKRERGRDRE